MDFYGLAGRLALQTSTGKQIAVFTVRLTDE